MTAAALVEELGRGWASLGSDYVLLSMAARLLREYGSKEQRDRILPGLAAGTIRVAFSLSEPGGGTDLLSLQTRATLEGDEWVIDGQKLYTSRAPEADYIVVLARTDEPTEGKKARGLSLVLAEKPQEGIAVRKLNLVGYRSAGTSEVWEGRRARPG